MEKSVDDVMQQTSDKCNRAADRAAENVELPVHHARLLLAEIMVLRSALREQQDA